MAQKTYGKQIAKLIGGILLLIVAAIGLAYGSLLRGMDQAAADYQAGDAEGALKKYEGIEARLRAWDAIRLIPAVDRRNLILNQARLLYGLGRYDEALDKMDKETEISGNVTDGRFLLLKGEIAYHKATAAFQSAKKKDPQQLEEALRGAEDNLRDALRMAPDDWDAKYNFEFVDYMRGALNKHDQGQMKILMQTLQVQTLKPKQLTPEQQE